ncbi:M1 family metallopeptidase [Aquimarina agarilytica]|uniref:M1 family metallopeptidase n=1 Tax=Aquimarina agarilytica TaxID=1087449 RepID=UPI0002885B32|nr:M1 family metallopeptidase [Aquimarina agarilytica]
MSQFIKITSLIFSFCASIIYSRAQQKDLVDFKTIEAHIQLDTINQKVFGKIDVLFTPLKNTNQVYLDAQKMETVTPIKDAKVEYKDNKIWLKGDFKANTAYSFSFNYSTTPKKALYFWGWDAKNIDPNSPNHKQIWTQGQGKYTSNWLPSIDDMNDKIIFTLKIDFNTDYQVISNGSLIHKTTTNTTTTWVYQMQQPMSSYLVALAIGKYLKKEEKSASGVPLENYIYSDRITDYESTFNYHKKVFDFLETEIGIPYPWKIYRQVPVRDFLYAGMENTACTLFSDDFIVDTNTFDDQNFVNVSAHELAHQWFGNIITETDSNHHWLHEGFATYFALLAEKELFGEDHFYYKLYESAEQLNHQSDLQKGKALVTPKGSSLTYYQHGAWAIVALRNNIGDAHFKKVVQQFLTTHQYKNVTTYDFLSIVFEVTGKDTSEFAKKWLHNTTFPAGEALKIITQSEVMKRYLQLAGERTQPLIGKYQLLSDALDFPVNPYLGQEVVAQLQGDFSKEALLLLEKAFESNQPQVLQALANSLTTIPKAFEPKMALLLKADSYATVEGALYNLWNNFEAKKMNYLQATKNLIGFNDKNIRTLWLVLALNTPGFSTTDRTRFFNELNSYTAPNHHYRLRSKAFEYLKLLQSYSDQSLQNLALGATHPNWRFKKNCSTTLKALYANEKYTQRINRLSATFPNKVKQLLTTD